MPLLTGAPLSWVIVRPYSVEQLLTVLLDKIFTMVLDFIFHHRLMTFLVVGMVVIVMISYLLLRRASWIFRKGRFTILTQLERDGLVDLRNMGGDVDLWVERYDIRLRLYYKDMELYTF